jgi:hypothetical protein
MTLGHQFLGEVGNDTFRSPIEPRRNALDQRCDLGDLHWRPFIWRENNGKVKSNAVVVK